MRIATTQPTSDERSGLDEIVRGLERIAPMLPRYGGLNLLIDFVSPGEPVIQVRFRAGRITSIKRPPTSISPVSMTGPAEDLRRVLFGRRSRVEPIIQGSVKARSARGTPMVKTWQLLDSPGWHAAVEAAGVATEDALPLPSETERFTSGAIVFEQLEREIERCVERGWLSAAAISVREGDGTLSEFAVGAPDWLHIRRIPLQCAVKPLVAYTALSLLNAAGRRLDESIATLVPQLAGRDWSSITPRQILTHQVPFKLDADGLALGAKGTPCVERLEPVELLPGYTPGRGAWYSGWAGWCILGAVIEQLAGLPYHEAVKRSVLEPAGMNDTMLVVSPDRVAAVAVTVPQTFRFIEEGGGRCQATYYSSTGLLELGAAGFSGVSTTQDLTAFYNWTRSGIADDGEHGIVCRLLATPARVGIIDHATGKNYTWALGATADARAFEPLSDEGSFGHAGGGITTAWANTDSSIAMWVDTVADPATGLVRDKRMRRAIATDMDGTGL